MQAVRRAHRRVKGDFAQVFKSITADNGSEFLDGKGLQKAALCDEVYYAHSFSSWERGATRTGTVFCADFAERNGFQHVETKRAETNRRLGEQLSVQNLRL